MSLALLRVGLLKIAKYLLNGGIGAFPSTLLKQQSITRYCRKIFPKYYDISSGFDVDVPEPNSTADRMRLQAVAKAAQEAVNNTTNHTGSASSQ